MNVFLLWPVLHRIDAMRIAAFGEVDVFAFIWSSFFLMLSLAGSVVLCGGLIGWPISPELKWGLIFAVCCLIVAGAIGLLAVPTAEQPAQRA